MHAFMTYLSSCMAPDMDDEEVMKQRMSWSPAVLAQDNNAGDTKLCKMELQSTV